LISLLLATAILTSISAQAVPSSEESEAAVPEAELQEIPVVEERETGLQEIPATESQEIPAAELQEDDELPLETISGYCGGEGDGTNLTWTLTPDGTLTISGMDTMENYSSTNHAPWYDNRPAITNVVIESGVIRVGSSAFAGCSLNTVTLPTTLESVGASAFDGTVKQVYIPSVRDWLEISWVVFLIGVTSIAIPIRYVLERVCILTMC